MTGVTVDTALIGGIPGPEFASSWWGVRPLHAQADLDLDFGLPDLWRLLDTEAPYLTGSVRLSRARSRDHDNRGSLDLARNPREGRAAAARGLSLTVNHLQRFVDPSGALGVELHRLALAAGVPRSNIQVAAFYSAPGSRAFGRHTDPNHVFSVQVEGKKVWELGGEGETDVVDLLPGDVLYVPTDWPHAVGSGAAPSLSLNFIVKPLTWRDVLSRAFTRHLGPAGEDLPWGWLESGGPVVPARVAQLVEGFAAAGGPGWTEGLAASLLPEVPSATFVGRSPSLSGLSDSSRVGRCWAGRLDVQEDGAAVRVRAPGRAELRCPREAAAVLTVLDDVDECDVHDLPGAESPGGRLEIIRQLVLGGFATVLVPGDPPISQVRRR